MVIVGIDGVWSVTTIEPHTARSANGIKHKNAATISRPKLRQLVMDKNINELADACIAAN